MKHDVKVRDTKPPAVTKGYRVQKTGPVRTNAKGPKVPHKEAPWPGEQKK